MNTETTTTTTTEPTALEIAIAMILTTDTDFSNMDAVADTLIVDATRTDKFTTDLFRQGREYVEALLAVATAKFSAWADPTAAQIAAKKLQASLQMAPRRLNLTFKPAHRGTKLWIVDREQTAMTTPTSTTTATVESTTTPTSTTTATVESTTTTEPTAPIDSPEVASLKREVESLRESLKRANADTDTAISERDAAIAERDQARAAYADLHALVLSEQARAKPAPVVAKPARKARKVG